MLINGLKSIKTKIFLNQTSLLSYMDLTKYLQSTEFPMFCPSKSGSGGVENLPLLCRIKFAPTVGV